MIEWEFKYSLTHYSTQGLYELYSHHLSAVRNLVISILRKYPGATNTLFSGYILCYYEHHLLDSLSDLEDRVSFLTHATEPNLRDFDRDLGFDFIYMLNDCDFSLGDIITIDSTLQSYAIRSHTALALYFIQYTISGW